MNWRKFNAAEELFLTTPTLTLEQLFEQVYLINLPERRDRLKSARRELGRIGSTIGEVGVRVFPGQKFSDPGGFPNVGSRGAFCSHWGCVNRALESRKRSVLILEDDIAFTSSLPLLAPVISNWINSVQWDVIFFGHYQTGDVQEANRATSPTDLKFEEWNQDVQGLHFYALRDRVLPRLANHLAKLSSGVKGDQEGGPMPVDGALNIFRRSNPDVRTFIAKPKLGWQLSSRSDITPKPHDLMPALTHILAASRTIRRFVRSWRA